MGRGQTKGVNRANLPPTASGTSFAYSRRVNSTRGILVTFVALLGALALLSSATAASRLQSDPVLIESKSRVFRLGCAVPIVISTREAVLSKSLGGSNLFIRCADGRERKLASSAQSGKVRIEQGAYIVDVDAGQLAEAGSPGSFEITYQLEDGHRSKPFFGKFVKAAERPVELLDKEKDNKKGDFSKIAVLLETDEGNVLIGLRPDKAPATARNFVKLASDGFYNNLIFHRVKRGQLLQGGGVKADGTKTNADKIKGEFSDYTHERGVISMARFPEDKDSATSQFFICLVNLGHALDGKFASFGKVLDGFEVIDRMAMTTVEFSPELSEMSKPKKPPAILAATCVERP
ncbi:MAG: peptidylprolyl isomerase [Planctomycetes bacterium]|nr:peptidylprolyl isomerase [Planctomycetota bacterium]